MPPPMYMMVPGNFPASCAQQMLLIQQAFLMTQVIVLFDYCHGWNADRKIDL
jgi:hypothetical protein